MTSARQKAYWIAAIGLLLVGASFACVTYAFPERAGLEFWLAVIPVALAPYAVTAIAVATVRGGRRARGFVSLAALLVVTAGGLLLFTVALEARFRANSNGSLPFFRLARETGPGLAYQAVAALAAAFVSGRTWERRPRYGLWLLFGAGFAAFFAIGDFSELLGVRPKLDVYRGVEALFAGRLERAADIAAYGKGDLLRIGLPAALFGWLAQCAVPGRPRRVQDQAADYAELPLSRPTG